MNAEERAAAAAAEDKHMVNKANVRKQRKVAKLAAIGAAAEAKQKRKTAMVVTAPFAGEEQEHDAAQSKKMT